MFLKYWEKIIILAKTKGHFLSSQKALLLGVDTFLRRPENTTKNAPHFKDATDLKRIMIIVVVALLPCALFGIWNTGRNAYASIGISNCTFFDAFLEGIIHVGPLILLSYSVGGFCEILFAQIRKHEIAEGLLVTGLLYPLICPPSIPWWMFITGIVFGIIIGKELFGGTGMNIVNPALFSRAFLFFSYPGAMSGDEVWIKKPFYENSDGVLAPIGWTTINIEDIQNYIVNQNADVISGQTPLALATHLSNMNEAGNINTNINAIYNKMDMFLGYIPGSIGETSTVMCLIGALVLLITRVGSWHIMIGTCVGALLSVLVFSLLSNSINISLINVSLSNHLIMGGFAFGAIFMATDPVSGPLQKSSRLIYGIFIGFLCVLIRSINPAFPEGMMMSILFMNIFSPLIDYYITNYKINQRKRRKHHA